jgi:membrane protease YdiL (CAAX protease family)
VQTESESGLTHGDAIAWSLAVTLAWLVTASMLISAVPAAQNDLVMLAGAQIAVYLAACAWFAGRRPGRSWSQLFAYRRTSAALLLVSLVLGVALYAPAELVASLIERRWPLPKELVEAQIARLAPRNLVHGTALAIMVALAGPFVEELFFRGALYTGLRAKNRIFAAAGTSAALFTLSHPEPRTWAPILALAAAITYLRVAGGSLWPGLLLHAGFNGTAVAMSFLSGGSPEFHTEGRLVAVSAAVALVLLALAVLIARRSESAARARAVDESPPLPSGPALS